MIQISHFRSLVIRPALEAIGLYSPEAAELLLGTALQESALCYLKQINGPALGVFQMEPATHDDIHINFLAHRQPLADKVLTLCPDPHAQVMAGNMLYAAAMARIHYLRVPDALPKVGNLEGQAAYWKQHYNTPKGRGAVDEYIDNWRLFIG